MWTLDSLDMPYGSRSRACSYAHALGWTDYRIDAGKGRRNCRCGGGGDVEGLERREECVKWGRGHEGRRRKRKLKRKKRGESQLTCDGGRGDDVTGQEFEKTSDGE